MAAETLEERAASQGRAHLEGQEDAVHAIGEHLLGQVQAETLQRRPMVTSKWY